jgi:CelD/BcsL family acetyltransferase involved in cellulose biosynthesis
LSQEGRETTKPFVVEEVGGLDGLRRLAPDWNRLVEQASVPDFFQTWEWVQSWLEVFCEPERLVALLVRDGTRLVAVFPILGLLQPRWWSGSRFFTPVNKQTPQSGLLHSGPAGETVRAVLGHLRSTRRRVSLTFPSCPAGSPVFQGLIETAAELGWGVTTTQMRNSPRLRITTDWASYLATRPKRVRKEWERKRRRLEEAGHVEFEIVTGGEIARAMDEVLEIERHSWKEDRGTSFTAEEGLDRFYGTLARRCAERGWLRLHLLRIDGRPAAFTFAVSYAGELLALKTSYDSRLRGASPGIVLMLHAVEQAFAEGMTSVNLLGDASRWKSEITDDYVEIDDVCLFTRGIPETELQLFMRSHVRPLVRRYLPALTAMSRSLATKSERR